MRQDRAALIALCESIAKSVMFRAMRKLHNKMDAEDATQEILIRVCSKIQDLKDPKAFGGWLNSIIKNETNRYLTLNAKHNNVVSFQDYLDAALEEDEELLPQEFALKAEDRRAVMAIIDKLPERQMEAVMLHYYEGLSVTETAATMGIAKSNVTQYLNLARDKIKSELEEQARNRNIASGMTLLPLGPLLTQALQQEAEQASLIDGAWIQQAVNKCIEYIGGAAAGTGAVVGASAAVGAAAGGVSGILMTVGATVAVVAMLATGIWVGNALEQPPDTMIADLVAVEEAEVEGTVLFTGESDILMHVNPTKAIAVTSSSAGEMTVHGWMITPMYGGAVLFSGEGGIVEDALIQMQEQGISGEYLLVFLLEGEKDYTYRLSRSFYIR